LFAEASLQVNREDRIGLVGPNGAGKTTLFRMVLQVETPDQGTITLQRGTTLGYLPQENASVSDETVLELTTALSPEISDLGRCLTRANSAADPSGEYHHAKARFDELGGFQLQAKAKKILAGLGFREKAFDRPCQELSGGWVMRAHLARLLVQEPDLL